MSLFYRRFVLTASIVSAWFGLSLSSCAKQSAAAGNGPEHPTPTSEKPDPAPGSATPAAIVADSPKAKVLVEGLNSYAAVRKALAADDLAGAKAAAPSAASKVTAMKAEYADKAAEVDSMVAAANKVASSADIATARMAFGEFSRTLIGFVAADKGVAAGVVCYRCPMAKTYQKWLQLGDEMGNPYWGAEMLKCGSKVPVAP